MTTAMRDIRITLTGPAGVRAVSPRLTASAS